MLERLRVIAATVRANRRARRTPAPFVFAPGPPPFDLRRLDPDVRSAQDEAARRAAEDLLGTEGLEHGAAEDVIIRLDTRRPRP